MELFSDKITRNRFYDLVKSGNLENTENCRTLSGGEKQRLSFLRSINFDKRILIMDESFNMVQNDMKKEILKTINEDSELTVVYISHDHSDYISGFTRIFEFSNKKVNVSNIR